MRKMILLLCFVTPAQVLAGQTVYKYVDASGTITFTDQAQPGAEEIVIDTPKASNRPAIKLRPTASPPPTQQTAFAGYQRIAILQPAQDETIWDSTGNIPVSVQLVPELQTARGHQIILEIDGDPIGEGQTSPQFLLPNVDRGSHSIRALVLSAKGKRLKESSPITFHLKRYFIRKKDELESAK
jgi:hypothetical protein